MEIELEAYIRFDDGARMIQIKPGWFVNEKVWRRGGQNVQPSDRGIRRNAGELPIDGSTEEAGRKSAERSLNASLSDEAKGDSSRDGDWTIIVARNAHSLGSRLPLPFEGDAVA